MTKLPFTMRVISCALIATAANQSAQAKGFTFLPEIEAKIGFDDNVYLLSDQESSPEIIGSDSRSDVTIEAAAGFAAEYKDNVQNFQIDAKAFRRDYNNFGVLDFTGGSLDANWSWNSSKIWHTEIGYSFKRDQSNFSEENLAQGDLFNQNRLYLELCNHLNERNDLYFKSSVQSKTYQRRDVLESERYDVSVGFRRNTTLGNTLAFELTRAEGDYPNRLDFSQFSESLQSYSQDEATIKVEWKPGERSQINANIGYINREHNSELSEFDYNGLVYDFRFKWDVGYRTQLSAQYVKQLRDTENTRTVFNQEERLRANVKWHLSNKLWFISGVTLIDVDFVQNEGNRKDFATILEAGVKYDVDKRSSVEFKFKSRARNSNDELNEFDSNLALLSYQRYL